MIVRKLKLIGIIFDQVKCCLTCFTQILTHWLKLRIIWFIWSRGECDRLIGDVYSSLAPNPTSGIFNGPISSPFYDLYFLLDLRDLYIFVEYILFFLFQDFVRVSETEGIICLFYNKIYIRT
jgi:hypothetical protein